MMFLDNISKRGKLGQKEKLGDVSHVLADSPQSLKPAAYQCPQGALDIAEGAYGCF